MVTRGSYVYISMGIILGGIPIKKKCYGFMQFSTKNWWFRRKTFTGLWELIQLLWTIPIRENFNFHHLPKLYFGFKRKVFFTGASYICVKCCHFLGVNVWGSSETTSTDFHVEKGPLIPVATGNTY